MTSQFRILGYNNAAAQRREIPAGTTAASWFSIAGAAMLRIFIIGCAALTISSTGQAASIQIKRERAVPYKPSRTTLSARDQAQEIVLKFHEGTRVRHRAGRLVARLTDLPPPDHLRRQRLPLTDANISADVEAVNRLGLKLERLFVRPEDDLDAEREEGEADSDEELADLNLYYRVSLPENDRAKAEKLIDQLNALGVVEVAYAAPVGQNAAADIAPITQGLAANQGYVNAAPAGIDANYLRTTFGTRGGGIRVADVEGDWKRDHEDLPTVFFTSDHDKGDPDWRNHGTAVLGVIAAQENAYGMTGIAPAAQIGTASVYRCNWSFVGLTPVCNPVYDFANAVNTAASQLRPADVMLLEQHGAGPSSGTTCTCNCGQFEYVAMEYWQANYDAIRAATSRGIIVVEAAGNGSMNLDSSIYGGRFDRAVRDSGAILVGAGTSGGHAPECWTNYGSRVDVQGWGDSVATLGYGDLLKANGSDERQWYTSTFSGTSSASPIVTGAAALVQNFRAVRSLPLLLPSQMRDLLRGTGTAQGGSHQIGPLPNLREVAYSHEWTSAVLKKGANTGYVAPNSSRLFWVTATAGQTFTFSTCGGATFDTVIEIMDTSLGKVYAQSDDACGRQSSVTWKAPATGAYIARVRGYAYKSAEAGAFTLNASF